MMFIRWFSRWLMRLPILRSPFGMIASILVVGFGGAALGIFLVERVPLIGYGFFSFCMWVVYAIGKDVRPSVMTQYRQHHDAD